MAEYCAAQKAAFGDRDVFAEKRAAWPSSARASPRPWCSSCRCGMITMPTCCGSTRATPTDADADEPGKGRGPCETTSRVPAETESSQASDQVTLSNIKFGPIGSTFSRRGNPRISSSLGKAKHGKCAKRACDKQGIV
ncbi:hypothetical protein VTK56DRAFT_1031 [Thermocarpiscus australiensis]